MNYDRIYKALIDKRRKTPLKDGYKEHHHIIPKSMGGSDDFDNMVYLTAREHFVAHLLLARIHGGKMWFAVAMMCGRGSSSAKGVVPTSRIYELAKKRVANERSILFSGKLHPLYGKPCTEQRRKRIAEGRKGKTHTQETKQKMSESKKGYKHTQETKQKMSESRKRQTPPTLGKKLPSPSIEKRKKLSEAIKNQPTIKCPYCGLESNSKGNMVRFHFDNCKYRKP